MVPCRIITTYTMPIDIEKYYIVVRTTRDPREVRIIPYMREWNMDGSSSSQLEALTI